MKDELPIRLVISDEDPSFRARIRDIVEADSRVFVVGETRAGAEGVELAGHLKAEVLLLGLATAEPVLQPLRDLIDEAGRRSVRIILLIAAAEKNQIIEALQLGARGIVLKNSAEDVLLSSIRAVMAGHHWIGREEVSNLAQYLRNLVQPSDPRQDRYSCEQQILYFFLAGYSVSELAKHFKISARSVKQHLGNAFTKLRQPRRKRNPPRVQ